MNSAWARAVTLVPAPGAVGPPVRGVWGVEDWPEGLAAGPATAAGGDDDGGAAWVGVPAGLCWTGITVGIEGEYPSVLAAADGAAEEDAAGGGVEVRGRDGDALGVPGRVVTPSAGEVAPGWLPGSSTAPAKVSGRRGPSEATMAATVTAQIAVAAADNHSAGD